MIIDNRIGLKIADSVAAEFERSAARVKQSTLGFHSLFPEIVSSDPQERETKKFRLPKGDRQESEGTRFGTLPYWEPRISFELSLEEIRLIEEGIEPYDLSALEKALGELLLYEEQQFFQGSEGELSAGLLPLLDHAPLLTDGTPQSVIDSVLKAAIVLKNHFVDGPYRLILGKDLLLLTSQLISGRTLASLIEEELGEDLMVSNSLVGGVLLPSSSEDFYLKQDKDHTLVIEGLEGDRVRCSFTERFQVYPLNPNAGVLLQKAKKETSRP